MRNQCERLYCSVLFDCKWSSLLKTPPVVATIALVYKYKTGEVKKEILLSVWLVEFPFWAVRACEKCSCGSLMNTFKTLMLQLAGCFWWNWNFLSIVNWLRLICISYFHSIQNGFPAHTQWLSSAQTAHHRSFRWKQLLFSNPLFSSSTPLLLRVFCPLFKCTIRPKYVHKFSPTHATAIISLQLFAVESRKFYNLVCAALLQFPKYSHKIQTLNSIHRCMHMDIDIDMSLPIRMKLKKYCNLTAPHEHLLSNRLMLACWLPPKMCVEWNGNERRI